MANDSTPAGTRALTLALREPDALVGDLLELGSKASGADCVALLLLEDEGELACRASHGDRDGGGFGAVSVGGVVREALEGEHPLVISASPSGRFPAEWCDALGRRSAILAPLHTPDGPLGLLAFGWDDRTAGRDEAATAGAAARSVATVLDAAIGAEIERSRAIWREAAFDAGREPIGRALAAIYLRSGLLRLGLDEEFADDAGEIERLARTGLAALRRSEESLGEGSLSSELFDALLDLTED